MSTYIIKAQLSNEGGAINPQHAPDKDLIDGIEADGFLLMTMKDGTPSAMAVCGLTTVDLARLLTNDSTEAGSVIQQAIAIAEGLRKASQIKEQYDKGRMAKGLAELLMRK